MISIEVNNWIERGVREESASIASRFLSEIEWLAYLVTADPEIAAACVNEACGLLDKASHIPESRLLPWLRQATIESAIQFMRLRLTQLCPVYERKGCTHSAHALLPFEDVAAVMAETEMVIGKLDALCRFVLLFCSIEKRSISEAARLLGVSNKAVQGAYCAAMQRLEVVCCEKLQYDSALAAA